MKFSTDNTRDSLSVDEKQFRLQRIYRELFKILSRECSDMNADDVAQMIQNLAAWIGSDFISNCITIGTHKTYEELMEELKDNILFNVKENLKADMATC